MFLHQQMRPQTKYVDLGSAGQVPNILYYVGVEVDGNPFIASAKNKKLARKYAAIDACNQSFGTVYIKDENFNYSDHLQFTTN